MLALFDVLGFESRLNRMGLDDLSRAYDTLIEVVDSMDGGLVFGPAPSGGGKFHPRFAYITTEQAYFSDTILLWAPFEPFLLRAFCEMCCALICKSIQIGLPVRGALSVGRAIMDRSKGAFLGAPLVEAARMEALQRWLGMSFCHSFSQEPFNRSFDARVVMLYSKHLKDEQARATPHLVLDWPRHWRQEGLGDLTAAVQALDTEPAFHEYYSNTLAFVSHSEEQHDWFNHHQQTPANG